MLETIRRFLVTGRVKAGHKFDLQDKKHAELLLDYSRLEQMKHALTGEYINNEPFPHIVIDDFLSAEIMQKMQADYPLDQDQQPWISGTYKDAEGIGYVQKNKRHLADQLAMPAIYRNLIWELHSAAFLDWLTHISTVRNLIPDPGLFGAGIHQISQGGMLKVHADFSTHRKYALDRRLNFLLYLNKDWQAEWGGELELWDKHMQGPPVRIAPHANRCVIFSTTATSYHGHPHPLKCPEGVYRKSLALYYYSNGRPEGEAEPGFATHWQELPDAYK